MEDFEAQTGVNTPVQPAAEPTGDTGQPATGQGVTDPQPATEQQVQTVPYPRFKEVNDAKKASDERANRAEQDAANLRAQFSLLQQVQQAAPQPQSPQDAFAEANLQDDDIPTVKQVRQYAQTVEQRANQRVVATQQVSQREGFIKSKSDYEQLVGTVNYAGQFVASEQFQKVLAAEPDLVYELGNPATAPRIAYRATKKYLAEQELAVLKGAANQQQVDNRVALRTGPMSASAVGGGGAISPNMRPNPSTPEGKSQLLGTFQKALEGDFDN